VGLENNINILHEVRQSTETMNFPTKMKGSIQDIINRRWHTKKLLMCFVVSVSLIISYQTYSAISQDKNLTINNERENGLVVVRLLEEHANQQLSSAESRLNDVAEAIKSTPKFAFKDEQTIHEVIEEIFTNEGSSNSLLYVNALGSRWTSPRYFPYFVFAAESRPYIDVLINQPENEKIFIGQVMRRFVDNDLVLPIARNLHSSDGTYLGLISIDVSLDYFKSVYETVATKEGATISLLSNTGQIVVSSNHINHGEMPEVTKFIFPFDLGKSLSEGHFNSSNHEEERGGIQYTYKQLKKFPITLLYGRNKEVMMREWYERSEDRILFSAAFILLHLVLTWYLLRYMLKVESSEIYLRQSEERFTALFQYSPVALAMLNLKSNRLIEVNKAFELLFELPKEKIVNYPPSELSSWMSEDIWSQCSKVLVEQGYTNGIEVQLSSASGKIRWCKVSAKLINADDEQPVVFSIIDVTEIRQSEKHILKLNAELEQSVLERTSRLQDALASVSKLQSRLSQTEKLMALGSLVTGMAHELSNPIGNSVTTSSALHAFTRDLIDELLAERPRRSIMIDASKKIIEGTEIISRNLNKVVDLMATFKQVSTEHAMHRKTSFDLKELIESKVLSIINFDAKKSELDLDLQENIALHTYPDAIVHVVDQLIENSLRHAFENRKNNKIQISTREINSTEVEMIYGDNGVGVDESNIDRIFEPFYTTKLYDGSSGLGMHIVYNLVTGSLNGKIAVANRTDGGLLITVVFSKNAV